MMGETCNLIAAFVQPETLISSDAFKLVEFPAVYWTFVPQTTIETANGVACRSTWP
jgi:hypothetical protein